MQVQAITVRKGNILDHEGKLWAVLKSEIYQPGKGASVVQVEMRDIRGGNKTNVRFRTQEMVERVRLDQYECTFTYADGDEYHFMDKNSFEDRIVKGDIMGDQKQFLLEGMEVEIECFELEPLSVTLPQFGTYTIVEAGDQHTCARSTAGSGICWGVNATGQLGDGTLVSVNRPAGVKSPQD